MSFCKRLLASFLAASLALGVFCPVQAYAADRETPVEWAAWMGEALVNSFSDFVKGVTSTGALPVAVPAWTAAYATSGAMAQAVRDLPEYKELYGYNPLDHSTVIRSYDGGSQVSVLDADGLYNAWLWLHEGIPPQGEGGSSSEPLPSDAPLHVVTTSSLSSGTVTWDDGTSYNFGNWFANKFNEFSSSGAFVWMFVYASGASSLSLGGNPIGLASSSNPSQGVFAAPAGTSGVSVSFPALASALGFDYPHTRYRLYPISSVNTNYNLDPAYSNQVRYLVNSPISNEPSIGPDGYFTCSSSVSYGYADFSAPATQYQRLYLVCNCPVYAFGNWYDDTFVGPPAPDPVPPVGPSSPDIQNPEAPDVPESDGPIQYNTTTNVTVTLPDGTTTIVEAPTVDTLPLVHWLSIINSNLVAWSRTIYEAMDGWLANISQWLQEIYSEVEAFKLSMDAWMVSLLSAIDKLGGDWPMSSEDNTNYWNNVTVVNNNIWSGAPDLNAVNVVADDFERLKGKFPVSIPWDLAAILLLFKADPVTPEFSVPLVYFDGSTKTQTLDVDLEPFDGVMSTWRRLVFIAFAGALALKSKDLLENFAEVFNIV